MRPVPTGVERGPRRLGQPGCAHGAGRVSPSTSLEIEATAAGRDKLECSERWAAPGWAPPLSTSEGPWRSPPAATPTWHRRERACQWRGELGGAAAPAGRSGGPCIGDAGSAGGPRIRPGIVPSRAAAPSDRGLQCGPWVVEPARAAPSRSPAALAGVQVRVQVRFVTRPKSRAMRAGHKAAWQPPMVSSTSMASNWQCHANIRESHCISGMKSVPIASCCGMRRARADFASNH